MTDHDLDRAGDVLAREFPQASAAFLGGSATRASSSRPSDRSGQLVECTRPTCERVVTQPVGQETRSCAVACRRAATGAARASERNTHRRWTR